MIIANYALIDEYSGHIRLSESAPEWWLREKKCIKDVNIVLNNGVAEINGTQIFKQTVWGDPIPAKDLDWSPPQFLLQYEYLTLFDWVFRRKTLCLPQGHYLLPKQVPYRLQTSVFKIRF
jgi:hypothetical protein